MDQVSSRSILGAAIASVLPSSARFTLYHLSTPPIKTSPLFSTPSSSSPSISLKDGGARAPTGATVGRSEGGAAGTEGGKEENTKRKKPFTTLESHFFSISHGEILVFAIEILVYQIFPEGEVYIFVSKADSSGYLPASAGMYISSEEDGKKTDKEHKPPQQQRRVSVLRSITSKIVEHALTEVKKSVTASFSGKTPKITISLFARSQGQYLFPNSEKNSGKNVLGDEALIAWWCKVLDPVFRLGNGDEDKTAYLLVPGHDKRQTARLFPACDETGENAKKEWVNGYPFVLEGGCGVGEVIPRFPDDPKTRFLQELDDDPSVNRGKKAASKWNHIRTIDQFWELMSFRQECSLGRSVGFIWIVVKGKGNTIASASKPANSNAGGDIADTSLAKNITPATETDTSPLLLSLPTVTENTENITSPTSSSSSELTTPALTNLTKKRRQSSISISTASASVLLSPRKKKLRTLDANKPFATLQRKSLVLSAVVLDDKRYQRTKDSLLLHTDFSERSLALEGTRKWIERVYAAGKSSDVVIRDGWDWGEEIVGTLESFRDFKYIEGGRIPPTPLSAGGTGEESSKTPNVLDTGLVRKKSKSLTTVSEPAVNMLNTNLIRRKPKALETTPVTAQSVNTLDSSLARKKPKSLTTESVLTE